MHEPHESGHDGLFAADKSFPFRCDKGYGKYVTIERIVPMLDKVKRNPDASTAKSEARRRSLEKVYDYFDADHDGTVDKSEFHAFASLADPAYTWEGADKMFSHIDKDDSGVIDKKEFVGYMHKATAKLPDEKFDGLMARYKTTAGTAMEADIERIRQKAAQPPPTKTLLTVEKKRRNSIEKVFDYFDVNYDGSVDEQEFHAFARQADKAYTKTGARKMFQHIDKDSSGMIDKNEFVGYMHNATAKLPDEKFENLMHMYKKQAVGPDCSPLHTDPHSLRDELLGRDELVDHGFACRSSLEEDLDRVRVDMYNRNMQQY